MTKSSRHPTADLRHVSSYWERTHWPLQSLYFLLPLVVVYEVGLVLWAGPYDIRARGLLRAVFDQLGATGFYLPGLVVVVVLLSWHVVRRDPWRPEFKLYGLMWAESIALALPLFVFMAMLFRGPAQPQSAVVLDVGAWLSSAAQFVPLSSDDAMQLGDWKTQLVFSVGAGIYEELVFRLIAIALLHLLLVDVLSLPEQYGSVGAVSLSAVAFAMYHFSEANPFDWGRFAFYTSAGLYFAAVYVLRGFGIVVAVHALYDIMLALTLMWQE